MLIKVVYSLRHRFFVDAFFCVFRSASVAVHRRGKIFGGRKSSCRAAAQSAVMGELTWAREVFLGGPAWRRLGFCAARRLF